MDAIVELLGRMMKTIITLEAEVLRLGKELEDATQVRKEGLPKHEEAPKA